MNGRALATIAALALAQLCACSGGGAPPPNVIVITLDTVRADRLSSYGYSLPTTPSLDRLAAEGVRFENCAATAALTPVSHASILTGLNPYAHGLRVLHAEKGYRLPDSVPTLASVLREANYATAAILSAFPVSEAFGLDRGFEHFDNGMLARAQTRDAQRAGEREGGRPKRGARGGATADKPRLATQRRSDATTDAAIEWLAGARQPFCLWLHYWDVHDPLLVPPAAATESFRAAARARTGAEPSLYDVELAFLDRQIGRLLDHLRERGLYDSAWIAVTSDHGEGLGEHGWHAHRLLYEEQAHVPLIVKWPSGGGRDAPRGVVRPLVRTIDVFPTALEAAGVAPPARIEGRSLLALARGESEPPRLAYADQINKWDTLANMLHERPNDDLLHSLRDQRWKLIYRPLRPGESELYDLARDPDEAVNLYASEPERARALLADLEARDPWVLEDLGRGASDDEAADALRELGYLGDD
jgi:arylsulfatase A-like enzyme